MRQKRRKEIKNDFKKKRRQYKNNKRKEKKKDSNKMNEKIIESKQVKITKGNPNKRK